MADFKITEDTPKAVSRRRFIKGVIAGGAAVSSATYLFRASTLTSASDAGERLITINVNGQQRRVDVMKQETLAWTLRYKLGLTGTKLGCDRAECGACTVLIDDVPHYSCSTLTHTVREQESGHHRGTAERRWKAAPGATRHPRRAGFPVRLLYVRFRHGDGGFPKDQPESHSCGVGARYFGQPLPLPRL